MSESELMTNSQCAKRLQGLFYSKSDEKFTVRALLEEMFGEQKFERALDIGPGAGHISEPLARRTKNLVFVESDPNYAELLKQQFPSSKVIVSDFRDAELSGNFNLILLSHVLYYQPEETWLSSCQRLLDMLSERGELLVILNSDAGDWWKIIQQYQPKLGQHISFHYQPASAFRRELSAIASVQSQQYRFQIWIEPASWADFIGRQILELSDESMLADYASDFAQFAKQFKQIDGNIVMDFRSEVLRLRKR